MVEFTIAFVICYLWHAFGIAIGYHRMLSHHSFTCPKWLEYLFVMGGYLCFEGAPIWWATVHRAHHRYVDTPLDPHSPKFGIYNAHHAWFTTGKEYPASYNPQRHARDLLKDPLYRFLEQDGGWRRIFALCFVLSMAFRGLIWLVFGWQAALGSLLAAAVVFQIPLMLNVLCHIPRLGYKNYHTEDDSVNIWWLILISMGECWHSNHHAHPGSAKAGVKPWELDISWYVIKTLMFLGLAKNVKLHKDQIRQKPQTAAELSRRDMIIESESLVRRAHRVKVVS